MVSLEYSEAIVEAIYILKHSEEDVISKIPLDVIKWLKANASTTYNYEPDIDNIEEIESFDIKQETKAILAYIYKEYLSTEKEKIDYNNRLLENEKKKEENLQKEYINVDLFNKSTSEEKVKNNLPVEIKDNFFQKIVKKIRKLFFVEK